MSIGEDATLQVLAPVGGWCATLDDSPDPVFSGRVLGDGVSIDPVGVEFEMNPYDEFAVEEALKTRDASGEGTVGRLINDAELGRDVKGAVKELRKAGKQVAALSKNLNKISEDIQTNEGTANALLYGTEGRDAIRNIRDTFGQLNTILTDVREGDGAVNQLIYGELGDSFMTNLQNASDDIAFLTKEAREGKGTVGALLTDPSVYEDIKRLVGDLERNDILRALVRYSIRRDEPREPVEVTKE